MNLASSYQIAALGTPWGQANQVEHLAPGIVSVSTPSHGGIRLDADHRKAIEGLQAHNFLGSLEWWEEDCDWSVPYAFFAEEIRPNDPMFSRNYAMALQTVRNYHREVTLP